MSIQIEQGDYVFYQDATVGDTPVLWDWYFPGGSPTGSSLQNPIIQYVSPNLSGFNASLYVENSFAISSSKTETGAISVTPEDLSAINLSATPPIATLSQEVIYNVTGPTGKLSYYDWNLPGTGGFTGPTSQTQLLGVNSWLSLTGSELGSVFSTHTTTASVTYFSTVGNSYVASTSITFQKCGYPETFNFLSGSSTFPIPTSQYITVNNTSFINSDFGFAGTGRILQVNQSLWPSAIEISSSHVEGETLEFWSCSKDFLLRDFAGYMGPLNLLASKTSFDILSLPYTGWQTLSRYTQGNYMFPNDLSTYFSSIFYFGNDLITDPGNWVETKVGLNNFYNLFFDDAYYASQSSVSISGPDPSGNQIAPAALLLGLDGASGSISPLGLQCLPSYQLVGSDVILNIIVEFSTDGSIDQISTNQSVQVTISDSINSVGNSADGNLIYAQDTISGPGYVSLINAQLASASLSSNIEAFSSPNYCYQPAIYSGSLGTTFEGMKLVIKDNTVIFNTDKIVRVKIECNVSNWATPYNRFPVVGPPIYPGIADGNWLGFVDEYIVNPYQEVHTSAQPFRGFFFKGNT